MGLFDKKYCDVCGEKIGLLGNKKLEDANLCKKCAAKLSPWFHERRHSTLDEIKAQLEYRDQNIEQVRAFHTTRTIGTDMKILIDENARKFMVTRAKDLEEANPDVLDFSQVTGCNLDIHESKSEKRQKDQEGKMVSYNPPRYEYSYDFTETIFVNSPYFDEIRFRLNTWSVDTGERSINQGPVAGSSNVFEAVLNTLADTVTQTASGRVWNAEYQKYLDMGNQIKAILMNEPIPEPAAQPQQPAASAAAPAAGFAAQQPATNMAQNTGYAAQQADYAPQQAGYAPQQAGYAPQQNGYAPQNNGYAAQPQQTAGMASGNADAPKVQVKCPFCTALMTPTADGKCEYCGSPLY